MICDKFGVDDLPAGFGFVVCDVGSKSDVEKVFSAAEEKFGRVDVLVNNAGILAEADYEGPLWSRSYKQNSSAEFDSTLRFDQSHQSRDLL